MINCIWSSSKFILIIQELVAVIRCFSQVWTFTCVKITAIVLYITGSPSLLGAWIDHPKVYEPRCEKTGLQGFRPGLTQTRLYSYR